MSVDDPSYDLEASRGFAEPASKSDLNKYLCLGIYIGVLLSIPGLLVLCCLPLTNEDPAARKRFITGLLSAVVVSLLLYGGCVVFYLFILKK